VLLALLAALAAAAPAGAVIPAGNLIDNPGAELGARASNDTEVSPPDSPWTTRSNFTQVAYGSTGFPSLQVSAAFGGGEAFFAGGPANASSRAVQRIDVTGAAPEIDAGELTATLGAHLGGVADQDDAARVEARFVNADENNLGAGVSVGPVLAAERGGQTGLIAKSASAPVPAGTREIVVTVTATRTGGSYNDGYADLLSLTLARPGPPGGGGPPPGGGGPPPGGGAPPPGDERPAVTRLETAAPLIAKRPTVLNATTTGPVQRLDWDLDGNGSTEVSCPAAQSTLRFRAPAAGPARTVSVTAVSASGERGSLAQSFSVAPAAAGRSSRSVRRFAAAVARSARVTSCGKHSDLASATVELTGNRNITSGERDLVEKLRDLLCTDRTVTSGTLRVTGCFTAIRSEKQIPAAELASLKPVFDIGGVFFHPSGSGELSPTQSKFVERALDFTDAYIATGEVLINGVKADPRGNARIIVFPQVKSVFSSDAALSVGGIKLAAARAFDMNTAATASGKIPLGSFSRLPGSIPGLGGFSLAGNVKVVLIPGNGPVPAGAEITVQLELPDFLSFAGVNVQSRVKVVLTSDGTFVLDNLRIGPIDAAVGPVGIEALQIDYARVTREWKGQGKLCAAIACLDAREIPGEAPPGGVVIRDGELQRLFVNLNFPAPGITLFPAVQLNRVGAGIGLNPTRFLGGARVTALGIFEIDGALVLAFPSQATPFRLTREEAGNAFPARFYTRDYQRFTLALGADAFLKVPLVDERVRLGGAYFLYHAPGYVGFGGGVNFEFFDVISILGRADGEFNFESGRFNLGGQIRACLADIVCAGALAHISSVGVGGCVELGPINVGGGVRYSPFDVFLWPFDGCKWSYFYDPNVFGGAARAAQAGGPHVVTIKPGDPGRAVRFDGADGAPRVRVTTPGGQTFDSPEGPGLTTTPGVRIMRSEQLRATVVGLQDPKPGRYKVEPLPGSPAVAKVTEAEDQPDARISARVRGRGTKRTLTYDIGRRADQRVTFVETSPEGNRPIGTVGGGRGKLSFTPAPGGAARGIEAQFELAGARAETVKVARFRPPSARLGRPRQIRVRRRDEALRLSWSAVRGAQRYEVVLTLVSGEQRRLRTRGPRVTVRGVGRTSPGRIAVRATAAMRQGRTRSARFGASAPPPRTRVRPLPRLR